MVESVLGQTFVGVPRNSWPYSTNCLPYRASCAFTKPPCVAKSACMPPSNILPETCPPCERPKSCSLTVARPKCKDTFEWDEIAEKCVCPLDTPNYDELIDMCAECVGGMIWNELTEKCMCPFEGAPWNPYTMECACSGESVWNSHTNSCDCTGGRAWDENMKDCICVGDTVYDKTQNRCTCENGRVWNKNKECVCPQEKPKIDYFTGECVTCETGKYWNDSLKECVCLGDQEWNPVTRTCQCPWNRVWDPIMKLCLCGTGTAWGNPCESTRMCEISTEVFPECDREYTLSYHNKCYREAEPACDHGTLSSEKYCVETKRTKSFCPPGFTYSSLSRKCVSMVEPTCGPRQTLDDGECLEEVVTNPECPYGYDKIHDKCVTFKESHCPAGYENHFDKCIKKTICKEGQKLLNGLCVNLECPKGYIIKCGSCELPVIIDCPIGFIYDGTVCRRKIMNCPRGFILEEDTCIRRIRACPSGFIPVGHECHRKLEGCPPGFYLIHGVCKRKVVTSCPTGYHLDGDICVTTISRPLTTCSPDEEEVGDKCVKKVQTVTCNPGEVLMHGRCTYIVSSCKPGEIEMGGKCYPTCIGAACRTDCTDGNCLSGVSDETNNIYNNGQVHPYVAPRIINVNNVNVYSGVSGEGSGCTYKCGNNEKYSNNCRYVCQ